MTRSLLAALLLAAPAFAAPSTWTVDTSHSVAGFTVKHLLVSTVRGELGKVSGTVVFDAADAAKSSADITIDVKGITTRDEKRDGHLRSPDFFDAEKFPTATFKSTKVEAAGAGKLKLTGNLTMRGVTKEITLDAEGPTPEVKAFGKTKVGFSATGKLNRKDFGIAWSKTMDNGGAIVSDEVGLVIDVELDKAEAAPAAKK